MSDILKQQYDWIRSNRDVLFSFLKEIPLEKLHESVPGFGHHSIIKTHIHVIDSYQFWIGSFAAGKNQVTSGILPMKS